MLDWETELFFSIIEFEEKCGFFVLMGVASINEEPRIGIIIG